METRRLGRSGIDVTTIGLGLWAAGGDAWGPTDDQASLATIDAALERGVNFFDTADVYGAGHSEALLGRAMKGRRNRFVVATKIGWIGFDEKTQTSAYDTAEKVVAGVETNLRRLGTDYVDLIQCHINFRDPNMEHFVKGFDQLQRDGKVRAYGVSTSDYAYLQAFNADGGCASVQVDYSILNRTAEVDILPYCMINDVGVLVRGPLAMGILTGKFSPETRFEVGDFRQRWHDREEERRIFLDDLDNVERLRPIARGRTLAQLALQFTITHPAVTTVIPGAKTVGQLDDNLRTLGHPDLLTSEIAEIGAITPPGGGRKIWPA